MGLRALTYKMHLYSGCCKSHRIEPGGSRNGWSQEDLGMDGAMKEDLGGSQEDLGMEWREPGGSRNEWS